MRGRVVRRQGPLRGGGHQAHNRCRRPIDRRDGAAHIHKRKIVEHGAELAKGAANADVGFQALDGGNALHHRLARIDWRTYRIDFDDWKAADGFSYPAKSYVRYTDGNLHLRTEFQLFEVLKELPKELRK